MKILIIEDEKELRLTLRQFLEQEHFLVETLRLRLHSVGHYVAQWQWYATLR